LIVITLVRTFNISMDGPGPAYKVLGNEVRRELGRITFTKRVE